jgi:hypothetical protein
MKAASFSITGVPARFSAVCDMTAPGILLGAL